MPTVTIDDPKSHSPFPDPIKGTYNLAGGPAFAFKTPGEHPPKLSITVLVKRAGDTTAAAYSATAMAVDSTMGTWECKKPGGLLAKQTDYVITAVLVYDKMKAIDIVTDITT